MDKATIEKYAPVALVVIALIFQWNLFVTPEKLEVKHREILNEVAQTYTTKPEFDILKSQLTDITKKIDKIYEILSGRK